MTKLPFFNRSFSIVSQNCPIHLELDMMISEKVRYNVESIAIPVFKLFNEVFFKYLFRFQIDNL